ncbi:hypothetical protein V8B97DRAFT_1868820 [Scleroderma yunnanense]
MPPTLDTSAIVLALGFVGWFVLRGLLYSPHQRTLSSLYQSLGRILSPRGLPDYTKLTGFPAPRPLYHFDIDSAKPRPYRPFRWKYHQNMALKKLEADWWLELESTYRARITQRRKLFADHGKLIIDELPGSEAASRECMQMVIQYLCQRYPNQFQYDNWTGIFTNRILGSKTNITTVHPLMFLLDNVPEDFTITQQDKETGLYHLTASVTCSAVGWNLGDKIGKPLSQIHGPVPDYKEKMEFSMNRYFSKMPCDKPIQRGSWDLVVGEPLFLQTNSPFWIDHTRQDPNLQLSDIYLRVDWQTLRRMPQSRAILFNFKAIFTPLAALRREPYIPKLLLKVLTEGRRSILEYKGTRRIEHKVIPALREWTREQEEKGWIPKDWKEKTLDEDPFYPGWKDHYPIQD